MNKLTAATPIILALSATPSLGATVTPDISGLEGFTRSGCAGTCGNGTLWVSPKYFFEPGTTADFGTAFVIGDPVDHRAPCGPPFPSSCIGGKGSFSGPYFLTGEEGGFSLPPGQFDMGHDWCLTNDFCEPTLFRLLFTLGPGNDGIQFAFQGWSLNIVPVPLPPAWLLFLGGLALISCKINVGSRSIVVDRPQKI